MEYGKRQFQERYPDHEPLGRNVEATATMGLPHPYLTDDEVQKYIKILGLEGWPEEVQKYARDIENGVDGEYPLMARMDAVKRLIAGAIAEWADVKDDVEDLTWNDIDSELYNYASRYAF